MSLLGMQISMSQPTLKAAIRTSHTPVNWPMAPQIHSPPQFHKPNSIPQSPDFYTVAESEKIGKFRALEKRFFGFCILIDSGLCHYFSNFFFPFGICRHLELFFVIFSPSRSSYIESTFLILRYFFSVSPTKHSNNTFSDFFLAFSRDWFPNKATWRTIPRLIIRMVEKILSRNIFGFFGGDEKWRQRNFFKNIRNFFVIFLCWILISVWKISIVMWFNLWSPPLRQLTLHSRLHVARSNPRRLNPRCPQTPRNRPVHSRLPWIRICRAITFIDPIHCSSLKADNTSSNYEILISYDLSLSSSHSHISLTKNFLFPFVWIEKK